MTSATKARPAWVLSFLLSMIPSGLGAQSVPEDLSPSSEIQLHAEVSWIQPGVPFTAALQLTMDPGWHTYWVNGGDSGYGLGILWDLPEGFTAGPLRWPAPRLQPLEPLMSYGYEDELVLLVEITPPASLVSGERVELRALADWLVCADVCLPAQGDLAVSLPVRGDASPLNGTSASLIALARDRLPRSAESLGVRAWEAGAGYLLEFSNPEGVELNAPYFFADDMTVLEHASPQRALSLDGSTRLWVARSEFADEAAGVLSGLLVADLNASPRIAFEVSVSVEPALAEVSAAADPRQAPSATSSGGFASGLGVLGGDFDEAQPTGLLFILALAFGGGVLLNLMPCVFPVLSLKVLGFVERAGEGGASARRHGLAFGAGVIVSFWILAGVLLALRAGGETLGWGFQLQSPLVVAFLALGIFTLGLSLSGVLDVGLGLTRLGGVGGGAGYGDSFASGALAVAVATPCTAPFMGVALGYALVQPALVGMTVFTALALGLAAPYVLLSFQPRLLARLPHAGRWMETLKEVLAFPLYATVVWLVWVLARQSGVDAAALLLLALTVTGFGAWLWGRSAHASGSLMRPAAVLVGVAAGLMAFQSARMGNAEASVTDSTLVWEDFSVERVGELRTEGRPILVDFTAAWCLSCQVNERVALRSASVRKAFQEANVALVKADWTSRSEEITEALRSFGRSGVPLYVMYPADRNAPPELLPALLTPGTVVEAVARASEQRAALTGS